MGSLKHQTTKIGAELTGSAAASILREGRYALRVLPPGCGQLCGRACGRAYGRACGRACGQAHGRARARDCRRACGRAWGRACGRAFVRVFVFVRVRAFFRAGPGVVSVADIEVVTTLVHNAV